jgi:hypothetical protein
VTSSSLDLELLVHTRQAQLLREAVAERQARWLPREVRSWRHRLAARLYALATWLNEGAADARRGWKVPEASADRCNEVEYWCAFPPPLVH